MTLLTEVTVLFSWAFTPWYTFFLFRSSGHSFRKSALLCAGVMIWAILGFLGVRLGQGMLPDSLYQAQPVLYLSLSVALVWMSRWRLVGAGLSQPMLVGLQIFRLIGAVFLVEHARGILPGSFALPAGWGDVLVGLIALTATVKHFGQGIPGIWVRWVLWTGVIDFASAFFFGYTSSATPLQLFAFDQPNTVIAYPTGLIPFFLVPFACCAHILSWTELQRSQRRRAA